MLLVGALVMLGSLVLVGIFGAAEGPGSTEATKLSYECNSKQQDLNQREMLGISMGGGTAVAKQNSQLMAWPGGKML